MMDQYKEQYKQETEQIHAPADLIAKTKAAVREEEARIQRERTAQTARPGVQEIPAVQKRRDWGVAARRWAYPLTVVAAIFVLVSVSVMTRGLGKSSSDSAAYETAEEADSGAGGFASETAAESVPEEAFTSEETFEAETEGAASDMEMASAEDAGNDAEMSSAGAAPVDGTTEIADETKRPEASDELSSESRGIEDAMSQKKEEALTDHTAASESVSIKRVRKAPAFANSTDTETRTYEDTVFQVAREGDSWIAYVESGNGGGYVIRGEAETIEAFLEAGYQRLLEISF